MHRLEIKTISLLSIHLRFAPIHVFGDCSPFDSVSAIVVTFFGDKLINAKSALSSKRFSDHINFSSAAHSVFFSSGNGHFIEIDSSQPQSA